MNINWKWFYKSNEGILALLCIIALIGAIMSGYLGMDIGYCLTNVIVGILSIITVICFGIAIYNVIKSTFVE